MPDKASIDAAFFYAPPVEFAATATAAGAASFSAPATPQLQRDGRRSGATSGLTPERRKRLLQATPLGCLVLEAEAEAQPA